jgi:hypothetical protein
MSAGMTAWAHVGASVRAFPCSPGLCGVACGSVALARAGPRDTPARGARRGELGDTGQRREPGCRSGALWCNAAGSVGAAVVRLCARATALACWTIPKYSRSGYVALLNAEKRVCPTTCDAQRETGLAYDSGCRIARRREQAPARSSPILRLPHDHQTHGACSTLEWCRWCMLHAAWWLLNGVPAALACHLFSSDCGVVCGACCKMYRGCKRACRLSHAVCCAHRTPDHGTTRPR